ncbi:MAG: type IX secretion system membrane protein PorP/SprF [Bacteroidota bacterium]
MKVNIKYIIGSCLFLWGCQTFAQQDPQVTHYMYNTMTVNPGYTASRENLTITGLYRDQWRGIEGSPRTATLGIEAPLSPFNGIGLSIIQDELGPAQETYIDGNYAHQLVLNRKGDRLALGIKGGVRFFSTDWSKGRFRDPDVLFNENINSELLPSIGAGIFYYSDRAYFGVSTPNILTNQHYDEITETQALERIHFFVIGGYVFDLNRNLKFKPSFFVKQVLGAPISLDFSTNFLLYEKLHLGVNYRWDDSISALFGLQITPRLNVGYAFDYSINDLNNYNDGTHEIMLRFQLPSGNTALKSPRFF